MYILRRLIFFAFLAGICLAVAGAYDVFIHATALGKPEMISISELENNVPSNRHLIVSGGRAIVNKAVEYYRTRHGVRTPNSEIYFIPIEDGSRASISSAPPVLLVKMTADQLEKAKANGGFDSNAIEGIRMTHWDFEGKAEEYLVRSFGKAAVEKMVVLDYKKEAVGVWQGLGQLVAGLLLIGGIIAAKFYRPSAGKQKPPPLPTTPSRTAPSATPSLQAHLPAPPLIRRRRIGFLGLILLFVLLLSFVVIVSSGVWKRFVPSGTSASGDSWSDWQLPVRIGDNIQAVRAKLGQESLNGNRLVEDYQKRHHLTGYDMGSSDTKKLSAENTMTLYWQEKDSAFGFKKVALKASMYAQSIVRDAKMTPTCASTPAQSSPA
ncbi:MAG: hypothetical protein M3O66_05380 [Verrucomicrobiota bacterium]|nr:hypothetical protein [Verrucomicrobiota bacterium]